MRNLLTTLLIGLIIGLAAITGMAIAGMLLAIFAVALVIALVGKLLSVVFGPLHGRL